ncbi:MAG: hypothetical protein ACRC1K_15535 [Planctomycetia bacterium]
MTLLIHLPSRNLAMSKTIAYVCMIACTVATTAAPPLERTTAAARSAGFTDLAAIESDFAAGADPLDAVVAAGARFEPPLSAMLRSAGEAPIESLAAVRDPFLKVNVVLWAGRERIRRSLLDEAAAALDSLNDPAVLHDLVDPAALHFHRAVCFARLSRRDEALQSLDALVDLQKQETVPERYVAVGKLLRASLADLKTDGLDGIAHDMRDVQRRLQLGRTDEPTQKLEKSILDRLNGMIVELEEKQQSQNSSGAGANRPMDDSRPAGGGGPGKVADRSFTEKGRWGDLPGKQRDQVLQSIGRDFPGHYRDAVEQYFRKLSTEPSGEAKSE